MSYVSQTAFTEDPYAEESDTGTPFSMIVNGVEVIVYEAVYYGTGKLSDIRAWVKLPNVGTDKNAYIYTTIDAEDLTGAQVKTIGKWAKSWKKKS